MDVNERPGNKPDPLPRTKVIMEQRLYMVINDLKDLKRGRVIKKYF